MMGSDESVDGTDRAERCDASGTISPGEFEHATKGLSAAISDTRAGEPAIATKRTLAALSFAIERVALEADSSSIVIALFQRAEYFAPMAATYKALVDGGSTVVVMFAGEGDTPPGTTRVRLDDDDSLANEWSVIVLSATVGAFVVGADLDELAIDGNTLESRRRFKAQWGFDRRGAAEHARRVVDQSRRLIPLEVVSCLEAVIVAADDVPVTTAEAALGRAAMSLVASLDATSLRLDDVKAKLERETHHATRDPLTGLTNREGLERWLGGSALEGVNMPLIGVVMIDLDGFKAVNDTHGHSVGDQLLKAVAEALVRCTRPGDIVTRWGGDEFLVLCPGAEGQQLTDVASRMVAAVSATSIGDIRVGASAGTQSCRYRPLPMGAADEAMYAAKRAGGGRVVAIDPPAG